MLLKTLQEFIRLIIRIHLNFDVAEPICKYFVIPERETGKAKGMSLFQVVTSSLPSVVSEVLWPVATSLYFLGL